MLSKTRPLCVLTAWLLWNSLALTQHPSMDPPLTGRPADFSNIVGAYQLGATASPTVVAVEQPITLRITITGEGPLKYEPKREYLRIFPEEWDKDFYVEERREQHEVNRSDKQWVFVYRLRPKHTMIEAIEGIKLVTYNPNLSQKKRFSTYLAERIPLVVKPRPDSEGPALDVQAAPDSFYEYASPDQVTTPFYYPNVSLSLMPSMAFAMGVPLSCLLGAYLWRKAYPNQEGHRSRQRKWAAVNALADLRAGSVPVWQVVNRYFQARFDFALDVPTPAEVESLLLRRGIARVLCAQAAALVQSCDTLHYAQLPSVDLRLLSADAIRLIVAMEADPCTH